MFNELSPVPSERNFGEAGRGNFRNVMVNQKEQPRSGQRGDSEFSRLWAKPGSLKRLYQLAGSVAAA